MREAFPAPALKARLPLGLPRSDHCDTGFRSDIPRIMSGLFGNQIDLAFDVVKLVRRCEHKPAISMTADACADCRRRD